MLVSAIRMLPRIVPKSGQNNNLEVSHYQSTPDSVSFTGKEKAVRVVKSADEKLRIFLSEIFETPMHLEGSKFKSEERLPLEEIQFNKEFFYDTVVDGESRRLGYFDKKSDLGPLAKLACDFTALKSLVFSGAEGNFVMDPLTKKISSKFFLTRMPDNKISSALLSDEMKEVLKKEFAKHNDILKIKNGKDQYILQNEHLYEYDLESPMRNLIVGKS